MKTRVYPGFFCWLYLVDMVLNLLATDGNKLF